MYVVNGLVIYKGRNLVLGGINYKIIDFNEGSPDVTLRELRGTKEIKISTERLQEAQVYIPESDIQIGDWTGRILYEGPLNTAKCNQVINANRPAEGEDSDIWVKWMDTTEDENVFEHLDEY